MGSSSARRTTDGRRAPQIDAAPAVALPASSAAASAPCDPAQTAAIAASFADPAVPDDVGAVALVKDASCGTRYFTRGASRDVPASALHLVGSATKTYVASLVLLLVDDGLLTLSDPVTRWIPDVPGGDAVQVQHLLHHTSEISDYTGDPGFLADSLRHRKYTPRELLDIASHALLRSSRAKRASGHPRTRTTSSSGRSSRASRGSRSRRCSTGDPRRHAPERQPPRDRPRRRHRRRSHAGVLLPGEEGHHRGDRRQRRGSDLGGSVRSDASRRLVHDDRQSIFRHTAVSAADLRRLA
ncbi:serine hydrolase [Candidatus Binatia bacterium]|nr:serine hydrolase [Candidatus Binatia bacterium]